jgi:hypothetical protein
MVVGTDRLGPDYAGDAGEDHGGVDQSGGAGVGVGEELDLAVDQVAHVGMGARCSSCSLPARPRRSS